jgi:LCP family protein required for cell wall assembly
MPEYPYNPDDPTLRIPPPNQQQPDQGQNQQGKLVLGGGQEQPHDGRSQRRPYQYQPEAPKMPPTQFPPADYPPAQPRQQAQQRPMQPAPGPMISPNGGQSPYAPPVGGPGTFGRPRTRKRMTRRKGCFAGCLVTLVIFLVLFGFAFAIVQRLIGFGKTISTQDPISTQTNFMGTSDRVNLLIMGYGGTGHDGALLTDSMLVMSLLPQSHHTSLISVPRDLRVQVPAGSGNFGKINAVYEYASNFGKDPKAGGDAAATKISLVTGLDIKYWMTINFTGFSAFIDAIGGVDVNVPDSFTSNYPANDDPAINASWIKVSFTKGLHHFNGQEAIQYARARYVLDNLAEGTDFARSQRQQLIMKAALSKLRQISTWPSFYNALTALEHTIYTNLSLADLGEFALKMDLNDPKAAHIGLSTSNVLMGAGDGSSDLLPINNDWQQIISYVKSNLYT